MPPRVKQVHEHPDAPGHVARVVRGISMPPGPIGAATVCTVAISLISAASANMVYAMYGTSLTFERGGWTLVGFLLGGVMIYLFKCHTMIAPERK